MPQERILVLEPDPATLEKICSLLGSAGYSVIPTSSRSQALAVDDPTSLDLYLADLNVRNKSGLAVFQKLRRENPTLCGVALSRSNSHELAAEALRQGFGGLVIKPFKRQELLTAVSAALEQEKVKRENARLHALVPLYELSRAFMGTTQLDEMLDQIVATARQETHAEVVSLMLIEEDGRAFRIAAANGLASEIVETARPAVGSGIAGWVAEHGRPLIIGEGVPLEKSLRDAMGKPELVSALSLPLQVRGETIGVLNLARKKGAEPFTRGDLELASVLAGQAAVAIDKAQLIEDMQALIDTSQRLASALDLEEAASVILEAAAGAAQARRAALWLVEELSGELSLYKLYDLEPEQAVAPDLASLQSGSSPVIDEDRGVLWLPITRGDTAFGLIELHNDGMPPRPGRVGLLATLAHTAAAVIESHRLRAREAIAFRELGDALHSELNLQQVLERVLTQMVEACGAAGGTIFLLADRADTAEAAANVGEAAPPEIAWQVIRENQPLLLSRYSNPDHKMIRSLIAAPMSVGSRVEGAVVLHHRQASAFAARHLSLLTVLSNSSAHIVRNAQLYARSEEAVISEERTRIAREIHDGLAQDLSLLLLKVEIMRRLLQKNQVEQLGKEFEEMTAALRNDMREVRRTIFALRPLDLESLGFLPALEKFVQEFGQAHDIKTHLSTIGDGATLTPKLQTALFRLTQEALNNIRKHARAGNVWIELELADGWAALRVRDDGRGFEIEQALPEARRRGSVGLVQMQERAERAGGSFDLRTGPGQGTLIHVRLPIK